MSHRPNAKSLKKGQFVWNATLNSKWGKIWKSRKLGLIGCQQEGGRPRCSFWHFDNCRSTSLGSISTFFVHLFQFIFLYKKGKTPQLQDGASETVLSRYVKRPIQRNYTSHLSIPPNQQSSQTQRPLWAQQFKGSQKIWSNQKSAKQWECRNTMPKVEL